MLMDSLVCLRIGCIVRSMEQARLVMTENVGLFLPLLFLPQLRPLRHVGLALEGILNAT